MGAIASRVASGEDLEGQLLLRYLKVMVEKRVKESSEIEEKNVSDVRDPMSDTYLMGEDYFAAVKFYLWDCPCQMLLFNEQLLRLNVSK